MSCPFLQNRMRVLLAAWLLSCLAACQGGGGGGGEAPGVAILCMCTWALPDLLPTQPLLFCVLASAGVFSAGVPATFHANYRAALRFLEGLEAYCTTQAQVGRGFG